MKTDKLKLVLMQIAVCSMPILAIVTYYLSYLQLSYNLDSIYDEGFLYLQIQNAIAGEIDYSIWANFISLLPQNITGHIYSLRKVWFLLNIVSMLFFSICSCIYLKRCYLEFFDIKKILCYLSIIALLYSCTAIGVVANYNPLQQLWISMIAGLYLISLISKPIWRHICILLCGVVSCFSIGTILPSGILISCILILFVVILNWHNLKQMLVQLSCGFLGELLGLLLIHLFIADLGVMFAAMQTTAQTITTLNRGYDPLSFVTKILLYMRDYMICICAMMGIYYLGYLCYHKVNKILSFAFGIGMIVVLYYYQEKPVFALSTLISFPVFLGLIQGFAKEVKPLSKRLITKYGLYVLCMALPLISSIGTNIYLGEKMNFFIFFFGFLCMWMNLKEKQKNFGLLILLCVMYIVTPKIKGFIDVRDIKTIVSSTGSTKGMHLNQLQTTYFERVESILHVYDYRPQKDIVWSTQLDAMTLVYFDMKPTGVWFQPMDFLARPSQEKPDFLFCSDFDLYISKTTFDKLGWNIDDDYDKYFVGSPEDTDVTPYSTTRHLYCLKTKKIEFYDPIQ